MAETHTLTLTDFLLARIAEDEAVAQVMAPFDNAPRALAECEAKRRIVRLATAELSYSADGGDYLEALALPYADHPDYREEWKP